MTTEHMHADLAARAERDPHRPAYHFVAPGGWLNDPNGLSQWDGTFHLFYQYNPAGPVHDRVHWGHASSTDLIHWRDEPIALAPSAGPDAEGCWSGVLVNDGGTPTLVYSGHAPSRCSTQTCCVATGTADLRQWTKHPGNPVIPGPPDGLDVTELRDHTVWREDGRWHQAMGSGLVGHGGALLHFSGADLRSWDYLGPLVTADDLPHGGPFSGNTWECPDLFPLGPDGTWMLVFSAWDHGRTLYPLYLTGRLSDGQFHPDAHPRHLDLGLRHFYAPQSFAADDGRRIQFGWAQEARPDAEVLQAGWSGVMSLPRTLDLQPDGTLAAAPVAELDVLRSGSEERVEIASGAVRTRTAGDQLDLAADLVLPPGGSVEVAIRATEDLHEATLVRIERSLDGVARLTVDRSRSRNAPDAGSYDLCDLGGALPALTNDRLTLRILVDHSIVEVFAAGVPLTARIYPASPDATGVHVAVDGAGARVSLSAWEMRGTQRASSAAAAA